MFHSRREGVRWSELKLLERAGEIRQLRCQVPFHLSVNGQLVCKYVADFVYIDEDGQEVVEDVKGVATEVYRLKKKLMRAVHGVDIREVK